MRRDDVVQLLQEKPFRPIRLRLSNGITHEIRHPEMAIVTPSSIVVGIPATNSQPPAAEDYVVVSLIHVVQIEHLSPTQPSSST